MVKEVLNEEKEFFFAFLWLLPLIPICMIFILALINNNFSWILIIIFSIWFNLFGYIYYCNHYVIILEEENFIIKHKNNKKIIRYNEVFLVEELRYSTVLRRNKYKIYFKEESSLENNITICNKRVQRNIRSILAKKNVIIKIIVE